MDQQHSAVRESGRRMAFESILIIEDERHGNRSPILRTQRFADLGAGQPVPVVRQPAGPSTDQQQTVVVESHHRRIGSRNDQGAAHGFPATSRVANLHRGGRAEIGGEATHEDPASVEHRGGRFRDGDVVCRFGGEEFTIIAPGTSAVVLADRVEIVRQAISELMVNQGGRTLGSTTMSFGVATWEESMERDGSTLIKAADAALYRAKREGRNRVVLAEMRAIAAECETFAWRMIASAICSPTV